MYGLAKTGKDGFMEAAGGIKLTASQEDYLETIWSLIWEHGVARVSDIAANLNVSMPSVSGALKTLSKHDLVEYSPYKFVTLSDRGMEVAQSVASRHRIIRKFLADVLGVDEELADKNACRLEHAVDVEVVRRLGSFVKFMTKSDWSQEWPQAYQAFCGEDANAIKVKRAANLADIQPGQKAKVVRVGGAAAVNRRLIEMGLTRNADVTVLRIAPLGDPIEIKVRGYNLSLRKKEAQGVEIEELK